MKKLFTLFLIAGSLSAFSVNVTFTVHYDGDLVKDTMFIVGEVNDWNFAAMTDLGDGSYTWSASLDAGDSLAYYYITVNSWDSAGNEDWNYYKKFREYLDTNCNSLKEGDRMLIVPSSDLNVTDYWGQCPGYTPPVNVASYNANATFNAYPNPCAGLLNVDVSSLNGEALIEVMDLTGKIMLKSHSSGKLTEIDMSGLPSSLYIIRVSDGKTTSHQKLLLK